MIDVDAFENKIVLVQKHRHMKDKIWFYINKIEFFHWENNKKAKYHSDKIPSDAIFTV